ncbi:MAG: hypothetical protein ACI80S_002132, partial [Pseudohongiellaceae bacterium]
SQAKVFIFMEAVRFFSRILRTSAAKQGFE